MVDRLLIDHPHLLQRVPSGATLAAALVDADLVLPVLDGFDEIAEGLRPEALDALNATSLPLVLTSRREEFTVAVHAAGSPLVWAAGVELIALTPDDLMDYLPRTSRSVAARESGLDRKTNMWDLVLEALRTQDTRASRKLVRVLGTPLMVILARTMYSDSAERDPAELLDAARFPTEHALEEHLLAGFVPTVYRRRPPVRAIGIRASRQLGLDPGRVQEWIGHLAHHLALLDGPEHQDLAWWRTGNLLRRSTRIMAVGLVCALSVTVSEWFVGWIVYQLGPARRTGRFGAIVLEGALMGPVAGLAFGFVYWLLARPGGAAFAAAPVRLRLPGPRTRIGRVPRRTFVSRFGAGILGGFVLGGGCAAALTLERVLYNGIPLASGAVIEGTLINMLAFGLIFGSAAGLGFGLMAALEAPLDIASAATPSGLLSANRGTVARQVLVLVPVLTLTIAFGGRLIADLLQNFLGPMNWHMSDGLFIGAVAGLGGALSYALGFTAWGQWVVFSRICLPLTGKLPWDTVAFLDDAYQRGVLRQAGAVYQFRHSRLQHHLSDSFHQRHTDHAPADI